MTPVIFKREGRDVLAVFPTLPGTDAWDVTCYAHVGQHSSASLMYVRGLKPAHPSPDRDALKRELERIGYDDLVIVKRMTKAHHAARKREAART